MLIRGFKRLITFLGPLLILLFFILSLYDVSQANYWIGNVFSVNKTGQHLRSLQDLLSITTTKDDFNAIEEDIISNSTSGQPSVQTQNLSEHSAHKNIDESHRNVFSVSTANKAYFMIDFGDLEALNPNIIPHPVLNDTWIIVAQQQKSTVEKSVWCAELVCNAVFKDNGTLGCVRPPLILPITATSGDHCKGDLDYLAFNVGPHDARVFYGPSEPYAIYGSNSEYTCFGQWMLDFRILVDWGFEFFQKDKFRKATELQRPAPYGNVEKNWFVFWDNHGQIHAHYDVVPKRVFAKLEYDGSVGEDLAPLAAASDSKCMAKYMPKAAAQLESIHQATNSLSITLCQRSDPSCEANDANTFILTVFQHKSFYAYHSVYEPYVMLFRQTAPFEIHGISQKPIWIHGRRKPGEEGGETPNSTAMGGSRPHNHTDMFYITSLSWKKQGQKYQGYIDDVLFIAFGIEDSKAAGIDVVAGDLLVDLGLCSTL